MSPVVLLIYYYPSGLFSNIVNKKQHLINNIQ